MLDFLKIGDGDFLARSFGDAQQNRFAVKPIERHLVDGFPAIDEVRHRIEVRALMRRHTHVGHGVFERLRSAVRHDTQLGIHREISLPVDERMRQIDEFHGVTGKKRALTTLASAPPRKPASTASALLRCSSGTLPALYHAVCDVSNAPGATRSGWSEGKGSVS